MKKIILASGIILSIASFTSFKAIEKPAEIMENKGVPMEKRELLKKIAGRWITQTNIHAHEGKPASKVIGSDIWQWPPDGNFLLHTAYGIRDKSGLVQWRLPVTTQKLAFLTVTIFIRMAIFQ